MHQTSCFRNSGDKLGTWCAGSEYSREHRATVIPPAPSDVPHRTLLGGSRRKAHLFPEVSWGRPTPTPTTSATWQPSVPSHRGLPALPVPAALPPTWGWGGPCKGKGAWMSIVNSISNKERALHTSTSVCKWKCHLSQRAAFLGRDHVKVHATALYKQEWK